MLLLAAGAGLEQTLAARFDVLVALQLWGRVWDRDRNNRSPLASNIHIGAARREDISFNLEVPLAVESMLLRIGVAAVTQQQTALRLAYDPRRHDGGHQDVRWLEIAVDNLGRNG